MEWFEWTADIESFDRGPDYYSSKMLTIRNKIGKPTVYISLSVADANTSLTRSTASDSESGVTASCSKISSKEIKLNNSPVTRFNKVKWKNLSKICNEGTRMAYDWIQLNNKWDNSRSDTCGKT
ncbi:hypothetical protein IEQ34_021955 [Dendrobium chrysotoxum]|uniref:Uncharacterized protein n=1 Tax=Dendrobium chrysotoxum TaxID=161865 RepID=A0AAV7FJY0_DENCH|nr:hypothetical protein IEQ34_021955 [Dendrobium chrysotoxum]